MPDEARPSAGPSGSAELSPQIVRTANMTLRVRELLPAVTKLRLLAASLQGQVASEQLMLEEGGAATNSYVVLQVPAAQLDDALNEIGGLGEVLSRSVGSADVTAQAADIDARLRNLDASIARLTDLMDRAGNLGDLTSLEEQLTQRQGERDSLAAQQKALAGQVARSTITVTLATPGQVVTEAAPGFLGGLQTGWDGLVKALAVTVTMIGVLLPFAALLALILIPVLWWRRRNRRRVPAESSESVASAMSAPVQGQSAKQPPDEPREREAEDQH